MFPVSHLKCGTGVCVIPAFSIIDKKIFVQITFTLQTTMVFW